MENSFGSYLRAVRESRQMSIIQLSQMTGLSISYISRIETGARGAPKPEALRKISDALNLPFVELMDRAGYLSQGKINYINHLFKIKREIQEKYPELNNNKAYNWNVDFENFYDHLSPYTKTYLANFPEYDDDNKDIYWHLLDNVPPEAVPGVLPDHVFNKTSEYATIELTPAVEKIGAIYLGFYLSPDEEEIALATAKSAVEAYRKIKANNEIEELNGAY